MRLFHVEQFCAGMGWGDAIVPRGTIVRGHGAQAHRAVWGEKYFVFFGAGAALREPRFSRASGVRGVKLFHVEQFFRECSAQSRARAT